MRTRTSYGLLGVLLLLAACTTLLPPTDLFADNPCDLPCWRGLTPGQTTDSELDGFLAALSEQERNGLEDELMSRGCRVVT